MGKVQDLPALLTSPALCFLTNVDRGVASLPMEHRAPCQLFFRKDARVAEEARLESV